MASSIHQKLTHKIYVYNIYMSKTKEEKEEKFRYCNKM